MGDEKQKGPSLEERVARIEKSLGLGPIEAVQYGNLEGAKSGAAAADELVASLEPEADAVPA